MNKKTIAIFAVSMVLVCALSVFTTLALLSDTTDVVTNTFTSGNVTITLDETLATNGVIAEGETQRVQENDYVFTPKATFDKDPTIHVGDSSENCYVAALIEFKNVPAEDAANVDLMAQYGIANQIVADTNAYITVVAATKGTDGLYSGSYVIYYEAAKTANTDLKLFTTITTPDVGNEALEAVTAGGDDYSTIKVTGYAVQSNNNGTDALLALQTEFAALKPAA